jgi:WD40 repeat protein
MSGASESGGSRGNPYVGLDYYDEKLGGWFFGRDTETAQVITNLRAARLTLLHAESGVGKSSLLRAGAAWRMRRLADENLARRGIARSVPIVFSSWKDDPVAELAETIRIAVRPYLAGRPEPVIPAGGLDACIQAAASAARSSLLIMLDQFEEYFLYRSREPVPERFADELAYCINRPDLRANFLIAIREDAYAGLGDLFKGRIANVYGNYLRIEYLDRAAAQKAIRGPVEVYNSFPGVQPVTIQDELVAAVLDQVRAGQDSGPPDLALVGPTGPAGAGASQNGHGDRVATPLLQLVMETVWDRERAEGSRELRLETLQELKGVRTIVDAHLATALDALGDRDRQAAIDMFDHLVSPSGGKIAESVPDLARRTKRTEDQVRDVLERLDQERIVRPIPAAPGLDPMQHRRYEIFHDVLAPTINRVLAAREEQLRALKLRRFAVLAVALLLVAVVVGGVFAALWHDATTAKHAAQAERLTAESRELAAEADVIAPTDPAVSALLALKAVRTGSTSQAEYALRAVLPDVEELRVFRDDATVYSAAFDPVDANQVVSADDLGIAWILDVNTGRRLFRLSDGGFDVTGGAGPAIYNATGTEVAVAYAEHRVAIFNSRDGALLTAANVTGASHVNSVSFIGSTGELAIATPQGLELWQPQQGSKCCDVVSKTDDDTVADDPANPDELAVAGTFGTAILTLPGSGHNATSRPISSIQANDAVFSPNGTQIATASGDSYVNVFNVATSQLLTALSDGTAPAYSVAFNPAGNRVVAGYSNGLTRVWDLASRLPVATLAGPASGVVAASFNPTGSEVVTASQDDTVRIWHSQPPELAGMLTIPQADGSPYPIDGVAFTQDGRRLLAFDSEDRTHVLTAAGQPLAVIPTEDEAFLTWNRSGTLLPVALTNGHVELWQLEGQRYIQLSLAHPIAPENTSPIVGINGIGTRLVVAGSDGYQAQVIDAQTGQVLHTLPARHAIAALTESPDGTQVVAGDYNGQLEVWNPADPKEHRVLGKPGPSIKLVEFDASGNAFSTISQGGVVSVWSTSGDRPLRSIDACTSQITVALSSSARMVAVSCANGSVPIYSVATGQLLTQVPAVSLGSLSGVWFSPNGQRILVSIYGPDAGGIEVWRLGLAASSSAAIEREASRLVPLTLTPAERAEYLAGIGD